MQIIVLGIFVADTVYRARQLPRMGETVLGEDFFLGPGGKGSNQAVAAAMAGGQVGLVTRLGQDAFAGIARGIWAKAGVHPHVTEDPGSYTGAAFVFLESGSGANAVLVSPGAGGRIGPADIDAVAPQIRAARVFLTQLEQPLAAAAHGLRLARNAGVCTILNPAPALELSNDIISLCDIVTPNETEAEALTGIAVSDVPSARAAADILLARGAGAVIVTLGAAGALWCDPQGARHIAPMQAGPVRDTTGAGDAFNGGLAVALAEAMPIPAALRFATATAALAVTRMGTAAAMPARAEIDALLKKG